MPLLECKIGSRNKSSFTYGFLFFCRVQGGTCGLRRAVRAASHRDHSPEDKPQPLSHTQKALPSPVASVPVCQLLKDPYQSSVKIPLDTAPADSRVTVHPTSKAADSLSNSKSLLGLYPEGPTSGRGRAVGRLGVSFCFSRRGPRLEPCASVFSDLEEEERDKREQMKERIKGIMEDIYREIEEAEGRKCTEGKKLKSDGQNNGIPTRVEAPAENGEIKKLDKTFSISTAVAGTMNLESPPRPLQCQMTSNGTEAAGEHTDIKHTDEPGLAGEDDQYVDVQGKDGTTCLRWPTSLIKFTKSWPHLCYSGNPRAQQLPQDSEVLEQKHSMVFSGKSGPCALTIVTPDTHTCLQRRQGNHDETRACRLKEEVEEDFKVRKQMEVEMEEQELLLQNSSTLSSLDTASAAKSTESCTSQPNPTATNGDLQILPGNVRRFRDGESESVLHQNGMQRVCTSPSRCECGGKTSCQCGLQICAGVFKLQTRKRGKACSRRDKARKKRKKSRRENASSKPRKVRSVVSNVSTEGQMWSEGWTRRRAAVRATSSCSLLGRCDAQPLSVFVRKRRPHRSPNSSGSQSDADGEPAGRRSLVSFFGEKRYRDRDVPTFPRRSRLSLHSPSSGCNSKLSWEWGHHSNPRSFIDCCYPDNSCACRKVLRGDKIFIHGSGRGKRSPRRSEVQGETETRGGSSKTTRVSDAEDWEWVRGRWRSRDSSGTPGWDGLTKLHCSPGSWCQRAGQLDRDEVDWDRWMWGSSDGWEERATHRSVSGSSRRGPDSFWRCSGSRGLRAKRVSSPDWWNSQHTSSPRSTIPDPRSCSPCSSTSVSELSWEWSRSSTSSGADRLTATSCRSLLTGAPGLSPDLPEDEAVKQDFLPQKSRVLSPVEVIQKHHNTDILLPKEVKSKSDQSTVTERLTPAKPGPQKSGRTLLLPLIGKLPAIQRKARRKTGLPKEEVKGKGGEVTHSQEHHPLTSNSHESKIGADTMKEAPAPPAQPVPPPPVSFTAEEMDKYRLLQEQAREHMQKVLEQTQETAEVSYTRPVLLPPQEEGKEEEEGILPSPPTSQNQTVLTDLSLSLPLPLPLVLPQQDDFAQSVAMRLPGLPTPQSDLHHVILQPTVLPLPRPVPNSPPVSSPLRLPPPPLPNLHHHLHLSPLSISSLFPSILLSHHNHPVALLSPTPPQLTPLTPVTLQPLGPGPPFVGTPWPVRFQQKAL